MTWFLCVSIHVWGRRGFEENTATLFFFFSFSYFCLWLPVRLFLILSMCRLTGLTFNIAVCLTFPFSRFLFAPILAFFVNVYTPVCLFENVWLCKLCVQVLIDWFDYLGIFLFVFALLLLLLLLWFCFHFSKKKPSSQTNELCNFFFVCFPPFRYVDNIDFWFSYFFPLSPTLQMSRKKHNTTKKDKNKTYYITNDIGDIITSIPRHLTNKKREHKLYTSSHIRTKRNTLSINPYVIIKTTWSCLLHSTFWGVMDSLSFFFVANPQEENIWWIKTVAAVAATWRWKIYFVCSRHRKRYLLLFSSHEKKKKKRKYNLFKMQQWRYGVTSENNGKWFSTLVLRPLHVKLIGTFRNGMSESNAMMKHFWIITLEIFFKRGQRWATFWIHIKRLGIGPLIFIGINNNLNLNLCY